MSGCKDGNILLLMLDILIVFILRFWEVYCLFICMLVRGYYGDCFLMINVFFCECIVDSGY